MEIYLARLNSKEKKSGRWNATVCPIVTVAYGSTEILPPAVQVARTVDIAPEEISILSLPHES